MRSHIYSGNKSKDFPSIKKESQSNNRCRKEETVEHETQTERELTLDHRRDKVDNTESVQ